MNDNTKTEYNKHKEIFIPIDTSIKTCTKCKKTYPATSEHFHRHKRRKDGLDPWCKECKKRYAKFHYQYKRYKITKMEFEKMLEKQKGKCLICGRYFDKLNFPQHTHIDHDHKTGKVRALLCNNCNVILGNAFDNPLVLINAMKYLKKHNKNIFLRKIS